MHIFIDTLNQALYVYNYYIDIHIRRSLLLTSLFSMQEQLTNEWSEEEKELFLEVDYTMCALYQYGM